MSARTQHGELCPCTNSVTPHHVLTTQQVHPSLISVPPSPSSIELNHAIDAILGSDSTVLATDVPDRKSKRRHCLSVCPNQSHTHTQSVFAKYEHANNGPAILNLAQLAELRGVVSSEAYASVQMSHEEIFAMIQWVGPEATLSDN